MLKGAYGSKRAMISMRQQERSCKSLPILHGVT